MIVKNRLKCQTTPPTELRDASGVGPGDRLEKIETDHGLILRPRRVDPSHPGTLHDKINRARGPFTEFPALAPSVGYDAHAALEAIQNKASGKDLILIGPYADFLKPGKDGRNRAEDILPIMGEIAQRSAVLLFSLNKDPFNRVGRRFDELQRENLGGD